MAKYGEWNRKGAALSDVTAKDEHGVSRDFMITGIEADKLEYREASMWGNPHLRILRSQLEKYIGEQLEPSISHEGQEPDGTAEGQEKDNVALRRSQRAWLDSES